MKFRSISVLSQALALEHDAINGTLHLREINCTLKAETPVNSGGAKSWCSTPLSLIQAPGVPGRVPCVVVYRAKSRKKAEEGSWIEENPTCLE